MSGWDDPATAFYYEAFCRSHSRYARANAALVMHAQIAPGMRVLDLAAGTARTAQAALKHLGNHGCVLCVEPAAAMREEGQRRFRDSRIAWCSQLQDATGPFDRILCGAAIWQLTPLRDTLRCLASLLCDGGALCFNIPALYLLEPDDAGSGDDPLLLSLPALLARHHAVLSHAETHHEDTSPLDAGSVEQWLKDAGLRVETWTFRLRLSQSAYAAWLKIPAATARLSAGMNTTEWAARIDAALAQVDRASWKWERWRGWTAWKL